MGSGRVSSQSPVRPNGWLFFDQAPLKVTIWLHIHGVCLPFPVTWKMSPLIMLECFVSEASPWCLWTRTVHPPRRGHDGFCSRFNSSANLNNKGKCLFTVTVGEAEIVRTLAHMRVLLLVCLQLYFRVLGDKGRLLSWYYSEWFILRSEVQEGDLPIVFVQNQTNFSLIWVLILWSDVQADV